MSDAITRFKGRNEIQANDDKLFPDTPTMADFASLENSAAIQTAIAQAKVDADWVAVATQTLTAAASGVNPFYSTTKFAAAALWTGGATESAVDVASMAACFALQVNTADSTIDRATAYAAAVNAILGVVPGGHATILPTGFAAYSDPTGSGNCNGN